MLRLKSSGRDWVLGLRSLFGLSLLLFALSSSYANSAGANTAVNSQVAQIFQQLSATPVLRANFEQQKKLASLNKSFVSKGQILFAKQTGVLWKIQQPVQADLVVTAQKIVQKTQRTQSQVDLQNSAYASVANMFLQLMAGDQGALSKNFDVVSAHYSPTGWNVALVPKSALFKKLFVRVEAQGQRFVNRIVITEQANNLTTIQFSQHSVQPQTLTAAENALFQLAK
ncbi:outer membrane lipoprotein carrier protein LolA [Acinetobacter calcoaceticus]|uniref:Outer membrane lipoprotein carrier protein LolA n=1 Tax=Acinetobacter calcoaceticus TaxID=471 RepID=A0A4R1XH90_ACICA|nr:outer membrane lipoprotein carrier protein LolA [Acinetobacter calcoaceticus]